MVRLPRDWLGPREELVPFGPRASSEDAEQPPPSANDFWGERSAAIHDALEAPADNAPAAIGTRSPPRFDRRPRASALGALAIALLVMIGIVATVSSPTATRRPAAASKVDVAAVFGSGASRLLHLGLAQLGSSVPRSLGRRAAAKTVRQTTARRASHRAPAPRPPHRVRAQLSSAPPVSTDTTHATTTSSSHYAAASHVDTAPTYQSAPPPSRPAVSHANVTPTGESGALGPIQSPNG